MCVCWCVTFLLSNSLPEYSLPSHFFFNTRSVLKSDHHTLGGVRVTEPKSELIDDKLFWEVEISLMSPEAEDEYTIAFHRCDASPLSVGSVSAEVDIIELNPGPDYLGAGLVRFNRCFVMPLPTCHVSPPPLQQCKYGRSERGRWPFSFCFLFSPSPSSVCCLA